jgi:hypothetical protein
MSATFEDLCRAYWKREVFPPTNYDSLSVFPREMGEKRRFPKAENWASYEVYIRHQIKNVENAFIAFYSDKEREDYPITGLYRLFLDVDRKDTWEDMKFFLYSFWNNIDVYFSGSKGFHVILYIRPENSIELPFGNVDVETRGYMRKVLSTWLQNNIDSRTFLDLSRMYRIAFTKHPATTNWKIPISLDWNLDTIDTYSKDPMNHISDFIALYQKPVTGIDWKTFLINPKDFILKT